MEKIKDALMSMMVLVVASSIVAALFLAPITIVLGCIKLIIMMFGG